MSDVNHTTEYTEDFQSASHGGKPLAPFTDPSQTGDDGESHELSDIGEATQEADPRQNYEFERDAGSDALDQ